MTPTHVPDAGEGPTDPAAIPPSYPVPQRPPLPKPERVSRGALTIAAVAMGTLVLAAVVFVQPGGHAATEAPLVPPPSVAEPTFLDQNASRRDAPRNDAPGAGVPGAALGNDAAGGASRSASASGLAADAGALASARAPVANGDVYEGWPVPAQSAARQPVDPDVAAYRAAIAAPLRARPELETSADAVSDGRTAAMDSRAATIAAVGEQRWGRQQRFMQDLGTGATMVAARPTIEPAPGPYAIQAGTMIPAVLLTEINSDLPGDVLAQVAHDVFDSREQQTLLIPKGSRLLGTYDNDVSSNQRRLFVAWTRLIFPDGRSLALPNLETKDRSGAGGVADRVETHRRRTLGAAALLSLVGAGAQLAQPNGGYGAFGAAPSVGQAAAGAAGQQLAQVTSELLRKQMDAQPTIRIRQGMPFQVFLRIDLAFSSPYDREGAR